MAVGQPDLAGKPPASKGISPLFLQSWAETPKGLGHLAEQVEPCCGLSPSAQCTFFNYLSISFELIQINFEFDKT
jgi:hypothetical protein